MIFSCQVWCVSVIAVGSQHFLNVILSSHIHPTNSWSGRLRRLRRSYFFDQDHEMNQPCSTMSMKRVTFILVILANNIFCTNTNTLLLIFQNCSERHLKSIPCLNDCKQYGQSINNICNLQTNLKRISTLLTGAQICIQKNPEYQSSIDLRHICIIG